MSIIALLFGVLTYICFLAAFTYLVLFIGGPFLQEYLPFLAGLKTLDYGKAAYHFSSLPAVVSNMIILVAFGVQHSIMARPGFKQWLTRFWPRSMERSLFVLVTSLLLFWLYLAWVPMNAIVWKAEGILHLVLTLIFLVGAGITLWSTFMINHWELFGLAQTWRAYKGTQAPKAEFKTPALYKYSRHPLYLGVLIVFWSAPVMTTGHLLFAGIWTTYMFIGMAYEERDLIGFFGKEYRDYMDKVPQILPIGRRK